MGIKKSNYSILVDVDLDTSQTQIKLNKQLKDLKIKIDTKEAEESVKGLTDAVKKLGQETNGVKGLTGATKSLSQETKTLKDTTADTLLTYQAANEILSKSIDIISSMVAQVFELDTALTEFKKVSSLNGQALDDYVTKLGKMGNSVSRVTSEMVEGASEFRKNGFNDEDSAQLAQIAA